MHVKDPVDLRLKRSLNLGCACFLFLVCSTSTAQESATATVGFSNDFPGADPQHYSIMVSSDGGSTYQSDGKLNQQSDADPFHQDFTVSEATRARIFDLAKRAHYFEGKVDSGKKNIASSGVKTLSFTYGQKKTQATYNYSPNPVIQELTSLFQNLSTTLEFGRRLEYDDHFQKLALDAELKSMEEMSQRNELGDISVIAPILETIAREPAIMNVVRARAERLLAVAPK